MSRVDDASDADYSEHMTVLGTPLELQKCLRQFAQNLQSGCMPGKEHHMKQQPLVL